MFGLVGLGWVGLVGLIWSGLLVWFGLVRLVGLLVGELICLFV